EILDFGLLGWAMSRYTGLWIGMKTVNETIEQTQTIEVDTDAFSVELPDRGEADPNIGSPHYNPAGDDITIKRVRMPLVHKFVRANKIDREEIGGKGGLGIVTAGKSYADLIQAMELLDLDEEAMKALGISIYKVGCVWPVEPEGLKDFARGRPELLFVEEKNAFIEPQAAAILYHEEDRPRLTGKNDENGLMQLPSDDQLEPLLLADVLIDRLEKLGRVSDELRARHTVLRSSNASASVPILAPGGSARTPWFCSGCPHNTSTRLPDGSFAVAGIGCHGMAMLKRTDTLPSLHMGSEGVNWAAIQNFSGTKHIFQNLGDGTYYHSGLLAIRAAIAAKANITYKILFNDAVAMTGGQPIDGPISVGQIATQVKSEGAAKVVIVSDDPPKHKADGTIPGGIEIHHRDDLLPVQETLREIEGVTVLIYEQTCAAEKRRRRKRGEFPNPAKRMFINHEVCEGCGDCSEASTCVSIQPVETALGTKRKIDQSSCNKDYSCVKGFCPSFVTVLDAEPRKPKGADLGEEVFADLPEPLPAPIDGANAIMIAGIGGTGVITVGAVMGMAAHLEDKACSIYDMTGLSQKNGVVFSHLKIANSKADLSTQRIGKGEADLVLAFDMIAALSGDAGIVYAADRTRAVGNSNVSPTAQFQFDRDLAQDVNGVAAEIEGRTGPGRAHFIDATDIGLRLMGDTIAANMFLIGYATQLGLVPLTITSLKKAIEMNSVAVKFNLGAFDLGRLAAHDLAKVESMLPPPPPALPRTLDEVIAHRTDRLTAWGSKRYAKKYTDFVARVRDAEDKAGGDGALALAVAKNLAKLMAYKDEYEVARLYSDPKFLERLEAEFEDGYKLKFNLAPPIMGKKSKTTGEPVKSEFGPWMLNGFRLLKRLKPLRGTRLDPFGHTAERKLERAMIEEYQRMMGETLDKLSRANMATAVEMAELPDQIRGFGHVKLASIKKVRARKKELLAEWGGSA
ncbi:MAG: indolepyruvate ferredoxin oxidoreductase family protein, partial [Pseudomonadota bacterium]